MHSQVGTAGHPDGNLDAPVASVVVVVARHVPDAVPAPDVPRDIVEALDDLLVRIGKIRDAAGGSSQLSKNAGIALHAESLVGVGHRVDDGVIIAGPLHHVGFGMTARIVFAVREQHEHALLVARVLEVVERLDHRVVQRRFPSGLEA